MTRKGITIATKLILVSTSLIVVVVGLFGLLSDRQSRRLIDDSLKRMQDKINTSLRQAGTTQIQLLAHAVKISLVQSDYATMQRIIRDLSEQNKEITAVAVMDGSGAILAHSNQKLVGTKATGEIKKSLEVEKREGRTTDDGKAIAFTAPLESGGVRIGTAFISYSLEPLRTELAKAESNKQEAVQTSLGNMLTVGVGAVLLGLMLAVIVGLRMSKPIKLLATRARQMANGDLEARVNIRSGDEIGMLGQQFNHMVGQLKMLMEDTKEKASMEKELEVASIVQSTLVPHSHQVVDLTGMSLAGYFQPATQCGGDWWSYYKLHDDRVLVIISDVTGHGVASAMITAAALGVATTVMGLTRGQIELKGLLNAMNDAVRATAKGQFAMTCFASIYDPGNRSLTYTNAGHNFPYLFDSKSKELEPLALCSNRLGDHPDGDFDVLSVQVNSNDSLFWYTDGIVECEDAKGEEFGERRLQSMIRKHAHLPPDKAMDSIVNQANEFYGGTPQKDDITLVVGKIM